jgi:hypothetical protein
MSSTNRRRSRTLRLVLAAVALLGIGAAITSAAWEDVVYVDVDIASGSMNLQGQVTKDGVAGGWQESNDAGDIDLAVSMPDLTPGDTHEFVIELQNLGTMTAYVTFDDTNLTLGTPGDCALNLGGDAIPAAFSIAVGGSVSWTLSFEAASDWDDACQGQMFVDGYVAFNATTDAP